MKDCEHYFYIPLFSVEWILREVHSGHNTKTQMHTSTYLWSGIQNSSDPEKDGFGNFNENEKPWRVGKMICIFLPFFSSVTNTIGSMWSYHTYTNPYQHLCIVSSPEVIIPRHWWFWKVEWDWKTMKASKNDFRIPFIS